MRLGAHVSTSGGLSKGIDRGSELGAETVQIFASSPRMWRFTQPSEDEVLAFREKAEAADVSPVFIHGSYLITIGGDPEMRQKSVDLLTKTMNVAGQIGAAGVIFHVGAHHGAGFDGILMPYVAALQDVLDNSPEDVRLIFENSAGMGSHMGSSFKEIGRLIEALDTPRATVCLDTQHAFAAGYNLRESDGIDAAMDEFDREIGLSRLVAVHSNDSKVKLGGRVDRHENIGDGYLGREGFETIMGHAAFAEVPFVLEVPGADKKGPDKENLDRLKDIRKTLGVSSLSVVERRSNDRGV